MSTKYKVADEVPSKVLCKRLEELAKGEKGINREFYMSVPVQVDHDADLRSYVDRLFNFIF